MRTSELNKKSWLLAATMMVAMAGVANAQEYAIDNDSGGNVNLNDFASGGGAIFGQGSISPSSSSTVEFGTTEADVAQIAARGSLRDGRIVVQWVTATESNNLGFFVLRSLTPVGPFEVVSGMIPGLGTTPVGKTYEFVDMLAGASAETLRTARAGGAVYYRIDDVDFSGMTKSWGPTAALWTDAFDGGAVVPEMAAPRSVRDMSGLASNVGRVGQVRPVTSLSRAEGSAVMSPTAANRTVPVSGTNTPHVACGMLAEAGTAQVIELTAGSSGLARVSRAVLEREGLTVDSLDRLEFVTPDMKAQGISVDSDAAQEAALLDVVRQPGRDDVVGYLRVAKRATSPATVAPAKTANTVTGPLAGKMTDVAAMVGTLNAEFVQVGVRLLDKADLGCK